MKKYIIIEADTNDGDYVTEKREITDEQITEIIPMVEAIKKFKSYKCKIKDWTHSNNYSTGECCREDLGELTAEEYYTTKGRLTTEQFRIFDNYVPHGEYGIHSIVSIDILEVASEQKLF